MTVSPFLLKMVKQSVLQRERGTEMVNPLCGLEPRVRRGMSGKDPLLACLSLNQVPKRPRNGQVRKPGKLCPAVKCLRCRANVKYGGHLTAA